jgi:NAD(P)-dependent dehydrogenase (short-subunit alcohol dehydrogenase family)
VVAPDRDALDLTDAGAVESFWDGLATTPRWVVNAAGGYRTGTVAETKPEDVQFLREINVGTAFWTCRAAARRLTDGAAIVNVAARSGISGGAGSAAYSMTKAAVIRLTQVLALELEGRVRVNAVVPALIATPANAAQGITGGTEPAEIANAIAYLLSDDASAVTGALISV